MRIATVFLVLSIAACTPRRGEDLRRFQLTGTVVSHDTSSSLVVVSHDAVAGLMPAMSMPFAVAGVAPVMQGGDRTAATLVVTASRSWLESVRITAAGRDGAAGRSGGASAAPGVRLPDFQLLDHNGRTLTMDRLAGRVRIITFIYTRCPLPDFCPLVVKHLEHVRRRANEEGIGARFALLAVTLDPGFDTPAVLRAYGDTVLNGDDKYDQWTLAGGTAAQIEQVARFFGVGYQDDKGLVTHTLSTTVVSHDSRIMRTFAANSWRPDDLFQVVKRGLERADAE